MARVLVTAALGNVGREVARECAAQGFTVRVADRDQSKAAQRFPQAEAVALDFLESGTWKQALEGCQLLFLLRPPPVGDMKNRAFAADYALARREIDTVDHLVRALDAAREKAGLTKTNLAKLVGMKPEVVRRLFTTDEPNPTLDTVVKLVNALNCSLDLVPRVGRRTARVRQAARDARL